MKREILIIDFSFLYGTINHNKKRILQDRNKYVVVKQITHNNQQYLYLMDINNYKNSIFCLLYNNNKVKIIKDNEVIKQLINLMNKDKNS